MRYPAALVAACLFIFGLISCIPRLPGKGIRPFQVDRPVVPPTSTSLPELISEEEFQILASEVFYSAYVLQTDSSVIAAGDLNEDGWIDLVSGPEPNLQIFLGDGQGGLERFSASPGGPQPTELALLDIDEDLDLDILVANHDTDYLTILLGDGSGIFLPAQNSPLHVDVLPHPHIIRGADLDLDGLVDLVVDHREGQGVLILPGLGQGLFATPGIVVDVGGDPYLGVAIGDINGDGGLDLVTPNPTVAGVFLNANNGLFSFVNAPFVNADAPFAVALGDFNGDRDLDLLAASDEGSSLVELFFGNGEGRFQEPPLSFSLAPGGKRITVGDFNGDEIDDAAIVSYHHSEVLLLFGGQSAIFPDWIPGGDHPWGLVAADLNGDGKDDLVVADDSSGSATVYLTITP